MTKRNDQTAYRPLDGEGINVNFSGTSATSDPIPDDIWIVRLRPTEDCYVRFCQPDGEIDATSSDMVLNGGAAEYFSIEPGTIITVISAGTDGVLQIMPMDQ